LAERVKELNCLYGLAQLVETMDISVSGILQGIVELIPPAFQYPDITCARIVCDGQEYKTDNFRATPWQQTAAIMVYGQAFGHLEVGYTAEKPLSDEGPFVQEERWLIEALTERLGRVIERKQAEEELRLNRQTLDYMAEGVILANPKGLIIYTNPAYDRMFGYEAGELSGRHISIVNAPADKAPEKTAAEIMSTLTEAGYWEGELVNIKKDGTHFPTRARVTSFQHSVYGLISLSVQEDITERKRAEDALRENEKRFKDFTDVASDWFWEMDSKLRYTFISEHYEKIAGKKPEELLGKTRQEMYKAHLPAEKQNWLELFAALEARKDFHDFVYTYIRPDGQRLVLANHGKAIFDQQGRFSGYRGVGSDITHRKQAEEALQQAKDDALAAQHAAEAASQAKSAFLSNMSHELRTPLNAILGFSQLLGHSPNLEPKQQENLDTIRRSGEHLLTLINQVLHLSKIEAGRLTLDETDFDIHHLLDDVESMFDLQAKEKDLLLHFECAPDLPRYVHTDDVKLRQVLINLLNNAIKITEAGEVTVAVKSEKQISEEPQDSDFSASPFILHFSVADTGPGIEAGELDTLFDAFVQSKNIYTAQGGAGLGLAISRQFVQLMGGQIQVESVVGCGSTFTFSIQVVEATSIPTPPSNIRQRVIGLAPNQPRYRILVVDDKV
ncbi:MAG: PAS domain S-box protein, partial [Deltaproteobacteria bacterium]|nr:PAS domain S-box protein [Deltaproteobacteria bacterium]